MRLTRLAFFAASFLSIGQATEEQKHRKPCTIRSPSSQRDFDLSGLSVVAKQDHEKKGEESAQSWAARGYDYGVNFTMNICAPVVEELDDVKGLDHKQLRNVSAFYSHGGRNFSIGQQSSDLVFRGRKLVLNYTDGSPCDDSLYDRKVVSTLDGDDEKDSRESKRRKKSSIISFLCEKDTYDTTRPPVAISFVGASPDECTYFFEARSHLACGGVAAPEQSVGPGSVFGLIALIAVVVYVLGGIAYQRTIMHQRGWRQIPNYSMWAGAASFLKDMIIILFSSCTRWVPRRRGYTQVPSYGAGRGRGGSREDENRLIDQLDEEWDD